MSALVEDLSSSPSGISDVSGAWQTRTTVSIDLNGGVSIDCRFYESGQCPRADLLAITDCATQTTQTGSTFTQASQCSTPPESPVQLGVFSQYASGTVNVVTGADGQSMTGFSTAGLVSGQSLWLASTTGHRVD